MVEEDIAWHDKNILKMHYINTITESCIRILFDTVCYYKNTELMNFNVGISANTTVFDWIRKIKSKLRDLDGNFKSKIDLEEIILNAAHN